MRSFVFNSLANVRKSHANIRVANLTSSQCLSFCERSHANLRGQPIRKRQQQTKMAATGKIEWTPELVEALIENVRSKKVI